MNIGSLTAHLGCDMTAFNAAIKKAEAELTGLSAKMVSTGKMMQSVGRKMTMALTLPLAAAGAGAFKLSKDFQASMSKITGLVGIAEQQVKDWSKEILQLAPSLGKAPKELADAMFFVTSAGIRGAEALEVLNMSAKASSAGLGETKVVADLVTSAMNAYGKENLNAAQATDILVGAVREGKAEAPDLAASMGQVLPVASEMNVKFHEVGAAIAAMTRTGTNAATASMQLRQILASLLKPSQQAEEMLGKMGTSAGEIRQTIKEKGLITALSDLKELTSSYGEEAMSKVFPNIRALSGVLDLMGKNASDNIAIFDSLSDSTGSLDHAFETTSKTAEFKWNQTVASMKTSLTSFGKTIQEAVIPILNNLTEKFTNLSTWFQNLSEGQKQLVVKIAGIVTALGPLLMIFGKLLTVIPKVSGAFVKMMKFAAANPWLLLAAALTAVVVAIVKMTKSANESAVSTEKFTTLLGQQQFALDNVFNALEGATRGSDEHKEAIAEINEKYGKYLPYLLTEKSSLEDIRQARILATDALRDEIAEKQRQMDLSKAETELLEANSKWTGKIIDQVKKKKGADAAGQAQKEIQALFKQKQALHELTAGTEESRQAALKLQKDTEIFTKKYGVSSQKMYTAMNNLDWAILKHQRSIEEVNTYYDAYTSKIDENADKLKTAFGVSKSITIDETKLKEEQKKVLDELLTLQWQGMKNDNKEVMALKNKADAINYQIKLLEEQKKIEATPTKGTPTVTSTGTSIIPVTVTPVLDTSFSLSEIIQSLSSKVDGIDDIELDITPVVVFDKKIADVGTSLGTYYQSLKDITEQQQIWGSSFDIVGARITALKTHIESLRVEGFEKNKEAIKGLVIEYNALIQKQKETQQVTDIVSGAVENALFSMSSSYIDSLGLAEDGMEGFLGALISGALDMIVTYTAMAMAAAIAGGSEAGAGTGVAAPITTPVFIAELLAVVLGAFASLPSFAEGGFAIGPQLAVIGDNPGRKEAIIPSEMFGEFVNKKEDKNYGFVAETKIKDKELEILVEHSKAQSDRR